MGDQHQDPANSETAASPSWDFGAFEAPPDDHGLSLEELSRTYAELIGRGEDPYAPAAAPEAGSPPILEEELEEDEAGPAEDCAITPLAILEAMLFVGHPENRPLSSKYVASLMRGVRPSEVDELVAELNQIYDAENCPYTIVSEGDGYRLVLRDDLSGLRDKFYGRIREARLSQSAVDVLALVAYHQGITREEVDKIRSKPSGGLLSQLVRRQLLRVERSDGKPRVIRYYTTDRFLELFGLHSLDELPRSQDLDRYL